LNRNGINPLLQLNYKTTATEIQKLIPAAACAWGWSKLRAPRHGDGWPCICHKSFLPMLLLSFCVTPFRPPQKAAGTKASEKPPQLSPAATKP